MAKRFQTEEELAAASALTAIMQKVAEAGHYETLMSTLDKGERAAVETTLDTYAAEMRDAGQPGW